MRLPLLEVEVLAGEENMGKQSSHREEHTFENLQLSGSKFERKKVGTIGLD